MGTGTELKNSGEELLLRNFLYGLIFYFTDRLPGLLLASQLPGQP
jgi:hypothetical protein